MDGYFSSSIKEAGHPSFIDPVGINIIERATEFGESPSGHNFHEATTLTQFELFEDAATNANTILTASIDYQSLLIPLNDGEKRTIGY